MRVLAFSYFVAVGASRSDAAFLMFSFTDPVGDSLGRVDVIGLNFNFDNATGAYAIDVLANPANPFSGSFRINVNLWNRDTGLTAENPSLFQDDLRDITVSTPTTVQRLTGTNPRLQSWNAGNRVAIGSAALQQLPGSAVPVFGSAVANLDNLLLSDLIGTASNNNGDATEIAIITAVPEPLSLCLFVLGIGTTAAIASTSKLIRAARQRTLDLGGALPGRSDNGA
jgi:hypothetical protein